MTATLQVVKNTLLKCYGTLEYIIPEFSINKLPKRCFQIINVIPDLTGEPYFLRILLVFICKIVTLKEMVMVLECFIFGFLKGFLKRL